MVTIRKNTYKTASPASAALIDLVRLLARQVAREWAERQPQRDAPSPLVSPEKLR
jgi:hypothetical protein